MEPLGKENGNLWSTEGTTESCLMKPRANSSGLEEQGCQGLWGLSLSGAETRLG